MSTGNSYNPYNYREEGMDPSSFYSSTQAGPSTFSKMLKRLSSWNWGQKYDDMITRNSIAIGVYEDPNTNIQMGDSMYDMFSRRAVSKLLEDKAISYLQFDYVEKQKILREYAIKDEIRNFIQIVTDEAIEYDDDGYFAKAIDLPNKFQQHIRDRYQEIYKRMYRVLGFGDGRKAWNLFRQFIIDGFLAFELVYDDKQKNIIDVRLLESTTLVPAIEPRTGVKLWIQFPDDPQYRKVLLDSHIVYMSYRGNSGLHYTETSYVENLIRPYNQLKLIEQTRIMFNVANASIYQKFLIPVGGLSKQRAEQEIAQLIADYRDEVSWDDNLGTVSINGSAHIPFSKQWWFPKAEDSPEVEIVSPEGANLNESEMLQWFFNILKRASMIPFGRLNKEEGGGNIFNDAAEVTRDEMSFMSFINRLRSIFKEVIVKPFTIQLLLEFPELKDDDDFISHIGVKFNSNNLFEKWKELSNDEKRANIISTLLSNVPAESEDSFFDVEELIKDVMEWDDERINKHKIAKLKKKKTGSLDSEGGEGGEGGFEGGEGGDDFDLGGGAEDFGGEEDFGGAEDFGGEDIGGGDEGGAEDIGGGEEEI
jgi:hypothetical protein